MRFLPALILLTTTGCGDSAGRSEEARSLVESTFAQTVKPGPFGTEALGKGVWYRAPAIDGGCLQNKNWGHVDDPMHSRNADSAGVRRVSPLYGAQRFWTATRELVAATIPRHSMRLLWWSAGWRVPCSAWRRA